MSQSKRSAGRSGRLPIMALAGILAGGLAAAFGAAVSALPEHATGDLLDRVNEGFGLAASAIVSLDVEAEPAVPLRTVVAIDGQPFTLDLAPHSVRADGYQVLVQVEGGALVPVAPQPIRTLRGVVLEVPGSVVAASRLEDGLHAMITLPDGDRYWVEPVAAVIEGAAADLHVVYHESDVLPTGGTCGVTDKWLADQADPNGGEPLGGGGSGGNPCGTEPEVAELGCDADFEYFNFWGSVADVESRINSVINTVNMQYEDDVEITHEITIIIVRTTVNDPYDAGTLGGLLDQFRIRWNNLHAEHGVPHDLAQLFTGRNLSGGVLGVAYLPGLTTVCGTRGYSVVENVLNFDCATDLSAHEMGHNWSADHCGCPGWTMNSGLTCANQFHPDFTIPQIISYRNSRTCLSCPGPINNLCATAPLQFAGSITFTNVEATTDGPSEAASCNFNGDSQIQSDVWYRYQNLCDGIATVSLCGSTYDTKLAVYSLDCPVGPGTVIACNRNFCGQQSEVSFPVTFGTQYRIRIGGHQGAQGTGTLTITCVPDVLTGACCFLGGICLDGLTEVECSAMPGGTYQNDGTDCGGVFCRDCLDDADCDDGDPCTTDSCSGGGCVNTPIICDDLDPCNGVETCVGGICQDGTPLNCDDADPCTTDSCSGGGCVNTPIIPCCGNGVAEAGEDCSNCPQDITCPPGTTCIGGTCICPEDVNADGVVNVLDLIDLLLCFGLPDGPPCDTGQDVNGDGIINVLDLIDLLLLFGTSCP